MNNVRRKELNSVCKAIENCKELIENILNEEQEYYDNIPENLLNSDRACDSEDDISTIEGIISTLEEAIDMFDDIS